MWMNLLLQRTARRIAVILYEDTTVRRLESSSSGRSATWSQGGKKIAAHPTQRAQRALAHTSPLHVCFPLSTFLLGGEQIHTQPGYERVNLRVRYEGEDIINGLHCVRIHSFRWAVDWKGPLDEGVFERLWLAMDRNYIPVRVEIHNGTMAGRPVEVGIADDLREIEPGVWFPYRFARTVYDDLHFEEKKPMPVLWRSRMTVSKVDLHPHYDISLFRDIRSQITFPFTWSRTERLWRRASPGSSRLEHGLVWLVIGSSSLTFSALGLVTAVLGFRWLRRHGLKEATGGSCTSLRSAD